MAFGLKEEAEALLLPVVLRALPVAIKKIVKSIRWADHPPIRILDERDRLVAASPVMTKSWGPSRGKQLSSERTR